MRKCLKLALLITAVVVAFPALAQQTSCPANWVFPGPTKLLAPTLTLARTSGSTPSNFNSSATFTVSVSGTGATPTGTVHVLDNGATVASGSLTAGAWAWPTSSLTVGTHPLTASYDTDGVYASAAGGSVSQVVNATAPGAPTIGTPVAGNASASVAFTAPANTGGVAITSYTATSSPGSFTATGTSSPITVSGLANGTGYTFTVTATNSAGTSSASAASASVTPSSGAVSLVSILLDRGTGSSISIPATHTVVPGFTPFNATNTAMTWQLCQATPICTGPGTGACSCTNATNGGAWGSLTAGVYAPPATVAANPTSIYLYGCAASGTICDWTQVDVSNTGGPTVPGAPTSVAASARDSSALVTFSPPASNGGATITGYTVTSTPGSFTGTGTSSPVPVTGLTNGTSYTFRVTATNSAGTGSASAASNSVTPIAGLYTYPADVAYASLGTMPTISTEPALGSVTSFSDLGTSFKRVWNGRHAYSRDNVWNSTGTKALVDGWTILNGTTYSVIESGGWSGQPANYHKAWANSAATPNIIYFLHEGTKQWMKADTSTSPPTLSNIGAALTDTSPSFGNYEGSLDDADKYVGIIIGSGGNGVRLLNAQTGASVCSVTGLGTLDNVSLTHDGKYFITEGSDGLKVYSTPDGGGSCTFVRTLISGSIGAHWDACVAGDGTTQLVVIPDDYLSGYGNAPVRIFNVATGAAIGVTGANSSLVGYWSSGTAPQYQVHISCRNIARPGYAYISSFSRGGTTSGSDFNRLFALKLDSPFTVENFAWEHNGPPTGTGDTGYSGEAQACPSRDGTKVWWATDWNLSVGYVHSFVAWKP